MRDRRGAISAAEGCMFGAMALFAVLLIGLLYIAMLRFREPPNPQGVGPRTGYSAPRGSTGAATPGRVEIRHRVEAGGHEYGNEAEVFSG